MKNNKLLRISGGFTNRDHPPAAIKPTLPKGAKVTTAHLKDILRDVVLLEDRWARENIIEKALIEIHYTRIIPKSKRAEKVPYVGASKSANDFVVGARFEGDAQHEHHVLTYCVPKQVIRDTIASLRKAIEVVSNDFSGVFGSDDIGTILQSNNQFFTQDGKKISPRNLAQIIVDTNSIVRIMMPGNDTNKQAVDARYVTFYDSGENIVDILDRIGLTSAANRVARSQFDNTLTALLFPDEIRKLNEKAGYLVAMENASTEELALYFQNSHKPSFSVTPPEVPSPKNEPVIGVIDTQFDEGNVYFNEWVEYVDTLHESYSLDDKHHGTEVASIIVDGPSLNPEYDDECGRFRVKFFGVARHNNINIEKMLSAIESAVRNNPQIHVWNLSLGTKNAVDKNSTSLVAARLDELQAEHNVIFVVSGTNIHDPSEPRIGSPADSLNSVVVNSTDINGKTASYSRKGPALSFFVKPDVCAFGGEVSSGVTVCGVSNYIHQNYGTSFAAPWISRKLAYMIDIIGLPRQVAKAILIDSAAGWGDDEYIRSKDTRGYGVVPTKISDILRTKSDEIKFFIIEKISKYETYMYNLPVPVQKDGKTPFIARATMCYFPTCSRSQGVDYTDLELNLKFGRVDKNGRIKTINDDRQYEEGRSTDEKTARESCRKWDNTKRIMEFYSPHKKDKTTIGNGRWGFNIKRVTRHGRADKEIVVGIVVTLREIHGKNYYDEFVRNCKLENLIVNDIDIDNIVELNSELEQEITLD